MWNDIHDAIQSDNTDSTGGNSTVLFQKDDAQANLCGGYKMRACAFVIL